MIVRIVVATGWLVLPLVGVDAAEPPRTDKYFKITVVDRQTGRGVPLVELRTVHGVRYVTDSNGVVAFFEPALMGEEVFFYVSSHGYEFPKDGFGNRGKALKAVAGGSARLEIDRINIAERLYRITGADIYADSVLVGEPAPLAKAGLNARVVGQDSACTALFQGKLHWFWGDTSRPSYPLGNFQSSGATSLLPERGGLDPERGIDLDYFTGKDGFVRGVAPLPGPGPTWIDGLLTLTDAAQGDSPHFRSADSAKIGTVPGSSGHERMFAAYAKIRGALEAYERGLAEFDPRREQFEKVVAFPIDAPFHPGGQPFHQSVDGTDYIYFATPFPLLRVKADAESLEHLERYEGFTCLVEGTRAEQHRFDRSASGSLRYGWRRNTPPIGPSEQAKLIAAGQLKADEALLQLQDVETGKPVLAHSGSVYWNRYRRRWIMIALELGGTSLLGEVWYAEADTPVGPWAYARKIVTHDRYDFYNPKQDPFFDKQDGRVIFFEGTYASTFSGNPNPTPRYDYNQIMYKLDLADERLALPVPVYRLPYSMEGSQQRFSTSRQPDVKLDSASIAFFGVERPEPSLVPVCELVRDVGQWRISVAGGAAPKADLKSKPGKATADFFALPADDPNPPPNTTPLYEFVSKDGAQCEYTTDANWSKPGFDRTEKPLCRVWRNPMPALSTRFDRPEP
jgi:hypothetical protein